MFRAPTCTRTSAPGPRQPIKKVDWEKRKERFEWLVATGQERRLVPQKRALSEIGRMAALGLLVGFRPRKCVEVLGKPGNLA